MQLHYKRSKKRQKLKQLVFLVNIATYRLLGRTIWNVTIWKSMITHNKFSEMLTQFIVTILVVFCQYMFIAWKLRLYLLLKLFEHLEHANGFSLSCILSCTLRLNQIYNFVLTLITNRLCIWPVEKTIYWHSMWWMQQQSLHKEWLKTHELPEHVKKATTKLTCALYWRLMNDFPHLLKT